MQQRGPGVVTIKSAIYTFKSYTIFILIIESQFHFTVTCFCSTESYKLENEIKKTPPIYMNSKLKKDIKIPLYHIITMGFL